MDFISTAFVTLTDRGYFSKAKTTIRDLRSYGGWQGTVVLIVVDFMPSWDEIKDLGDSLVVYPVEHINHTALWEIWKTFPIRKQADNRHFKKVYQWDKFQVFNPFFKTWKRIVFLDAGSRVCRSVLPLLTLEFQGKMLCPDDSDPYDNGNRLACQFDLKANPAATERLYTEFGTDCMNSHYFLNCFFMFDTDIIDGMETLTTLKQWMLDFPISCCNEMGIMNLYFHIKRRVWNALPQIVSEADGVLLYYFGWNEHNYRERPSADRFIVMKYPSRPPPVL